MTQPAPPTQDYASSVQGVALRATRLNADGTLKSGPDASYVMERFVSVGYTPAYDGGTAINLQGANGAMLVSYQTKNVLLRADMTVSIADPDPEFSEIMCGGTIFTDDTDPVNPISVGWAPAPSGTVSNPNGAALEVWSNAISGGRRATVRPYYHYVFPRVLVDPTGDREFANSVQGNEFSGYSESNPGFADGPTGDWEFTSDLPYQYARVSAAPTGVNGYVAVAPGP
jgi:hypothetical protein